MPVPIPLLAALPHRVFVLDTTYSCSQRTVTQSTSSLLPQGISLQTDASQIACACLTICARMVRHVKRYLRACTYEIVAGKAQPTEKRGLGRPYPRQAFSIKRYWVFNGSHKNYYVSFDDNTRLTRRLYIWPCCIICFMQFVSRFVALLIANCLRIGRQSICD